MIMEKKVTPTSTKTEILKAYNELLVRTQNQNRIVPKPIRRKR